MGNHFSLDQIPDLTNKIFVITGATSGIGYVTATEIARRNGHVIMCCTSKNKINDAIQKIHREFRNSKLITYGKLDYVHLNLMSLKSCETTARYICKKYPKLHCIINNAGISGPEFTLTKDNIESQFGINHMGHFVFTMLLVPLLLKTQNARIVNLSSDLHHVTYRTGILTIDQLLVGPDTTGTSSAEKVYKWWNAYGSSKLANILFTKYLALHLPVQCYAVHPGIVKTEIYRNISDMAFSERLRNFVWFMGAKSPAHCTLTALRAATDLLLDTEKGRNIAPSGTYFVPPGKPQVPSKFACDPKLAQQLWDLSISICKLVLGDHVTDEIQANLTSVSSAKSPVQ